MPAVGPDGTKLATVKPIGLSAQEAITAGNGIDWVIITEMTVIDNTIRDFRFQMSAKRPKGMSTNMRSTTKAAPPRLSRFTNECHKLCSRRRADGAS